MEVKVHVRGQNAQTVEIVIPDWSRGGPKQSIELSLYEAMLLRSALNRELP